MTKLQKYLLATSVLLILVAEAAKRVSLSEKLTIIVGLVEIVIATSIGAVFGISTFIKDNSAKQ